MENKYSLLILSCFMFISCSKDFYFKRDQAAISKELKDIATIDQGVRTYNVIVEQRFGIRTPASVMDSMQTVGAPMNSKVLSRIRPESDQIAKLSSEYREKYIEAKKAGNELMEYTAIQHRNQLYRMIKKYGYPSYDTRPWANDSLRTGIGFVLTHFDYRDTKGRKFLDLMIKEYKSGRANESDMSYFLWHVNGRDGVPQIDVAQWLKGYREKGLQPRKSPFN